MKDSSALVRYKAVMKFSDSPLQEKQSIGLKHISDPSKMVRIAASLLLVEMDVNQLLTEQRIDFYKARKEYETMLFSNADFPLGRLHLGDYYLRQKKVHEAISQYEMAIEMDSLLSVIYPNLATAYSRVGKNEKSMQALNQLVILEPEFGRGYYLRALLHYQLKNETASISDFKNAIKFDPNNFRSYYNFGHFALSKRRFCKC